MMTTRQSTLCAVAVMVAALLHFTGPLMAGIPAPIVAHNQPVVDGPRLLQPSGERFVIIEANSPENRLAYMDLQQLDQFASWGVNTLYTATLNTDGLQFGRGVSPFAGGRIGGTIAIDWRVLDTWRAYLEHWRDTGGITHLVLFEQETDWALTLQERVVFFDAMMRLLQYADPETMLRFDPLASIVLIGEEYDGDGRNYFWARDQLVWDLQELRAAMVRHRAQFPVSLHNPLNFDFFRDAQVLPLYDIAAIQGYNNEAEEWTHRMILVDKVPYNSERRDARTGVPPTAQGGVAIGVEWMRSSLRWGGAGAGYYWGYGWPCNDIRCLDATPNREVLQAVTRDVLGEQAWSAGVLVGRYEAIAGEPAPFDVSDLLGGQR